MHNYDEPVYLISVVAKVLNIHPQTLRQYEREGLIKPSRTDGKMRLYSEQDVNKIKMILNLTRDLGINLAGVDVIIRLKKQVLELENKIAELEKKVKILEKNTKSNKKSNSLIKREEKFDLIFYEEKS